MDDLLKSSHRTIAQIKTRLLIGGEWREASDGRTMGVENPATGEVVAHVADAGVVDAELAAHVAIDRQDSWAQVSRQERSDILRRAYDLVCSRVDELAIV